jgi:hypothetical protein
MSIPILPDPTEAQAIGRAFYVTVIDGARSGFLAGPYCTHDSALADVERVKAMACKANDRAHWYAFGTASAPLGVSVPCVFGAPVWLAEVPACADWQEESDCGEGSELAVRRERSNAMRRRARGQHQRRRER